MASPDGPAASAGDLLAQLDQRHDELLSRIDQLNDQIESALESVASPRADN